mmetsp:Transcript_24129/g.47401  ORF Transcript_24129/g.47401 Transcript_24129/m.47401 type:complete len:222 (+) Transcript_24129:2013-2678(+)
MSVILELRSSLLMICTVSPSMSSMRLSSTSSRNSSVILTVMRIWRSFIVSKPSWISFFWAHATPKMFSNDLKSVRAAPKMASSPSVHAFCCCAAVSWLDTRGWRALMNVMSALMIDLGLGGGSSSFFASFSIVMSKRGHNSVADMRMSGCAVMTAASQVVTLKESSREKNSAMPDAHSQKVSGSIIPLASESAGRASNRTTMLRSIVASLQRQFRGDAGSC